MRIYVPSRGRASTIVDRVSTIKFIPTCTLVVPPDEADRYRRNLGSRFPGVDVLPCEVDGIAGVRRWIGQHAASEKQESFCMMDDDLNFAVRKSEDAFNLRVVDEGDVLAMLRWMEAKLDKFAHVSISPRQANNNMPSGNRRELVKYNKRTLRVLAYQTKPFLAMKHGRVPVMEDFDVNLQLLRAGYANIVSFWWAQDQRETGSAGGCSSYRTLEAHNAAAHELQRLHPEFVKLRQKENKAGLSKSAEALRQRWEVTIAWEKAAAAGGCSVTR